MEIISNPTQGDIKKAAQALKDGHLVAFPTETVYGLGADATNEKAVRKVYSVKARPTDHPLIVHISSIDQLFEWAIDIPKYAIKLAQEFWPGPMTLILKRSNLAKNFITGGQEYVGIRVPKHSTAISLLIEFSKIGGSGIAAPSANKFGAVSPTSAPAVIEELGSSLNRQDLILNDGKSRIGLESTIINCTNFAPRILRPGAITIEMISSVVEISQMSNRAKDVLRSPGLYRSHYSPRAKVLLDKQTKDGDGFLALADIATPAGAIRLASPKNNEEFAQELYEALRLGDHKELQSIVVIQPLGRGLAEAIRDRLQKSAYME